MTSRHSRNCARVKWAKMMSNTTWPIQKCGKNWTWRSLSIWKVIMILIWTGPCIRNSGPTYRSLRKNQRRRPLGLNPRACPGKVGLRVRNRRIRCRMWARCRGGQVGWRRLQKATAASSCQSLDRPEHPARTSPNNKISSNKPPSTPMLKITKKSMSSSLLPEWSSIQSLTNTSINKSNLTTWEVKSTKRTRALNRMKSIHSKQN